MISLIPHVSHELRVDVMINVFVCSVMTSGGQPNSSPDSCSSDLKVAHSPHGWKVTYVITDLKSLPLIQETLPI